MTDQGGIKMLTVIAKLPVKEGKMDEALAAFTELIAKVASEEGTVLYSLNQDKANPNVLVVVEQYKDKAALEFHSSTPYFKAFFAASGAFIGGKPEMSIMKEVARV
jgi:quinol monooxygenase YgiN